MIGVKKFRDLSLIDLNDRQTLVIATDSAGGLGEKPGDTVRVDPAMAAYYTVVGPSMELLAFGAEPISLVNNLPVEMEPTGRRIIEGMEYAIKDLNIASENFITGSTEENFPVTTTGMGVTMLGLIDRTSWVRPRTEKGQVAVVVGLPKLGDDLREDGGRNVMDIARLVRLKTRDYIGEILPVGSKGILYELGEMARSNDLSFKLDKDIDLDLKKSAGPSTCVVVSMEESSLEELKDFIGIPVNKIARFI